MKAISTLALFIVCVLLVAGCETGTPGTKQVKPKLKSSYIDESIQDHQNLGWMGARSNPANETILLESSDVAGFPRALGGVVIRDVTAGHPAEQAGLKAGDVIVRVGGEWLPIKDDPTFDFFEHLEYCVSAGDSEIELGIIRSATYQTVTLVHGQTPLDEGLPHDVARLDEAADRALENLATLQNDDGSFGGLESSVEDRLKITSVAGLALLGSKDEEYQAQIDHCVEFIALQIDARSTPAESPKSEAGTEEPKQPGMIRMQPPNIDIDPLTAAYVMQFLAESSVQMMAEGWMNRIVGMTGAIANEQQESGGWGAQPVDLESSEDTVVDVVGTHTTNQVLSALGAWERKGMMMQPDTVSKACGYLKKQSEARVVSSLDRRTRAALNAGTAAALVAINCNDNDLFLKQLVKNVLERAGDVHTSPTLGSSGLVATALVARTSGKDDWIQFQSAARVHLAMLQSPDGSFGLSPVASETTTGPEADPHWHAAHLAIVLGMQRCPWHRITGMEESPIQIARNSDGEKSDGSSQTASNQPMPAGANVMTLSLDDLSGEGSLEDQIKEKLKEMGMEADNLQMGEMEGWDEKKEKKQDK